MSDRSRWGSLDADDMKQISYAAGHLVGSETYPEDPHAGDSAELAWDIFDGLKIQWSTADRNLRFRKLTGGVPVLGLSECGADMHLTVSFVGAVGYDRADSEALAAHLEAAAEMVRAHA